MSTAARTTTKSEETAGNILSAALELFREQGFDSATMRDIAQKAGVATGAAYYYYASKEAIVMDFYRRSTQAMQPQLAGAEQAKGLEWRLRQVIQVKLDHFAPNRAVLRALLRNGADPKHPLSPFSAETAEIRNADMYSFRRILTDCGIRIPNDLAPELPAILWFFQMGIILFWVTDDSPQQSRTARLLALSSKIVATLVRLSALPLMRPVRRVAIEVVQLVKGDKQ